MNANEDVEMREKLEILSEEVPFILGIEAWEQQFYVRVDGGRGVAERTMNTLIESVVGDEYEVELLHDFDTNDVDIRIVAASLKEEEREIKERINNLADKYDV